MKTKYWPILLVLASASLWAQSEAVAPSYQLNKDAALTADPNAALWRGVKGVTGELSSRGDPAPGHKMEVRSRWTKDYLYFLFVCPYEQLHLRPQWEKTAETNRLWEWDVAEVFVGADFEKIWQYREYQVSPRGEWVDLDIDRKEPKPEGGWLWNSGFEVAAKLDEAAKVWYGAMKIPVKSITEKEVKPGFDFRANFFRIQGPPPKRMFVAWQVTGSHHHIPEKFGLLRLTK